MMRKSALLVAVLAVATGAWTILAEDKKMTSRSTGLPLQLPVEGELPSFDGATGWLNSAPLTAAGLRGNVVVVDFWTYSCINWLRTEPYVRACANKYKDQGLVVICIDN